MKADSMKKQKRSIPHTIKSDFVDEISLFGSSVLGPIISEYLARLHAAILVGAENGTASLFCYRAGLRIYHLYRIWLSARGEPMPRGVDLLKISRLAALKASYAVAPNVAITGIGMQLANLDLHDVVELLLEEPLHLPEGNRLASMPLHEFINDDNEIAEKLRNYLTAQSELMEKYVKRLADGANRIALIDSGWAGTTQLVFEQAFPRYEIEGIYFGTIGRANILGHQPQNMHGLMFNTPDFLYDQNQSGSVFALHRHLIESLFEPDLPSIESLSLESIRKTRATLNVQEIEKPSCEWDAIYPATVKAVRETALKSPAERLSDYNNALEILFETLVYPSEKTSKIACGKYRSADLGRRNAGMQPLFSAIPRFDGDTSELRINESLWPAGQAALEYADVNERRVQQTKILSEKSIRLADESSYFVASTDSATSEKNHERDDVVIITRTKNRPVLLRRAANSVATQNFMNFEWMIVNDGGDLEDVLTTLENSLADHARITICHNESSLGMEAASNAGICNSASRWIVIHDDDDSWDPMFLKKTTEFLSKNSEIYDGVITGTLLITEEISGDNVYEHSRQPYQDWVKNVQIAEMATGNFFAPIAFVFSREIYDKIGGFDRTLPVLGDWDFNLRFLLEANIGVIDQHLAYYHHRVAGVTTSSYSNSVIGGIDRHISYNAIVRNKYIRAAATDPKAAILANLVGSGYLQADTRSRMGSLALLKDIPSRPQVGSDERKMDHRWALICALATQLAAVSNGTLTPDNIVQSFNQADLQRLLQSSEILVSPDFDDGRYLELYPDVAECVKFGAFSNGYSHYLLYGQNEGRERPTRAIISI